MSKLNGIQFMKFIQFHYLLAMLIALIFNFFWAANNCYSQSSFTQFDWKGAWGSDGPIEVGDLNGDGKTDVFMWRNSSHSWTVNLSTGNGFQQQEWHGAWGSDGPIQVGDLNGDGSADVFMWRNNDKSWTINLSPLNDNDKDGLNDNKEHHLLEKFRPYYKFSADDGQNVDKFAPTDVLHYISSSEIKNGEYDGTDQYWARSPSTLIKNSDLDKNLNLLLSANSSDHDKYCSEHIIQHGATKITEWQCLSDIVSNPRLTNYCLNPLGRAIYGEDWKTINQNRNIGLYGHVVPLMLNERLLNSDDIDIFNIDNSKYPASDLRLYYKVEYWQFFGFNRDASSGCIPFTLENIAGVGKPLIITSDDNLPECIADHEADWCTVQLLIDQDEHIVNVYHFAHGKEMRFDKTKVQNPSSYSGIDNSFSEWHGRNYNTNVDLNSAGFSLNNILTLYREPGGGDFTHPVVYIEYGGHEFWPSQYWIYSGPAGTKAYSHNGQGLYQFLTSTPPNLGEVEFPLSEYNGASLLMRFNGRWGTYNWDNDPPQGPPLHNQWNWPQSSSVRWLIPTKQLTF